MSCNEILGRVRADLQPQPSGLVQRVTRPHCGGHVGHVHAELSRGEIDRDRVIAEVSRVGVDGI